MSDLDELLQQGRAAAEAGELDTARQIYERCLELEPDNTKIQVRYGKILKDIIGAEAV